MADYPAQQAFTFGGGDLLYWMRGVLVAGGYVSWLAMGVPDTTGAGAPGGPSSIVPGTIVVTHSKKVIY